VTKGVNKFYYSANQAAGAAGSKNLNISTEQANKIQNATEFLSVLNTSLDREKNPQAVIKDGNSNGDLFGVAEKAILIFVNYREKALKERARFEEIPILRWFIPSLIDKKLEKITKIFNEIRKKIEQNWDYSLENIIPGANLLQV
jgi:hypothetical protein